MKLSWQLIQIMNAVKASGGMIAINSENGEIIWNHRIEEQAKFTKKGLITRTKKYAPSGSAVWNSPSIDLRKERFFLELAKVCNPLHLRTAIPLFL